MAAYKNKQEEKRTTPSIPGTINMTRRNSLPEEVTLRDLMREIQKISEKQDTYQKSSDEQMKILRKELSDQLTTTKNEITNEIGEMKKEMDTLKQEFQEIKRDKIKTEKFQGKIQIRMDNLEAKNSKLETKQELLEQRELEFQLKFRNIQEEARENLRQIIAKLTAEILQITEEEADENIDRAYRITTNYSKRNKVARDVIVQFGRRRYRDDILKRNNSTPVSFKGKKVVILKEFPMSTLMKRRKYMFLTEELKKHQIRFRWERTEGVMVTYKDEKYWLTTEEKAKDFYKKLKKEMAESSEPKG
uniref:L1 transposable element RRM domain-containing protein n=1 Tax=Anolis carolinensis TaxID=28377 RepID=A0A803TUJ6_ANOCA